MWQRRDPQLTEKETKAEKGCRASLLYILLKGRDGAQVGGKVTGPMAVGTDRLLYPPFLSYQEETPAVRNSVLCWGLHGILYQVWFTSLPGGIPKGYGGIENHNYYASFVSRSLAPSCSAL